MSKRDLEAYWDKREGVTGILKQSMVAGMGHTSLGEFVSHKEAIEKELSSKDPRAMRAVRYAAAICATEGNEIADELYPDSETRPLLAEIRVVIDSEKKLTFQVYDLLTELALTAANAVAPL